MMRTKKRYEKKKTDARDNNFYAQVAKQINKYIEEEGGSIEPIEQRHPSSYTNHDKWSKMRVGAEFYYVDVKHCYWRIAHALLGYITQRLYDKALAMEDFKRQRNMSLSLIVAPKKWLYYVNGEPALLVEEDKTQHEIIYANIRHTAWNIMGDLMLLLGQMCIGYRTDGIMVTRLALRGTKDYLDSYNLYYTVKKCKKADDRHYLDEEDGSIRKI